MKLIQHITVGSGGAASITFSSIPATFTDLQLVFSFRVIGSSGFAFDDLGLRINADSTSNYSNRILRSRDGAVQAVSGAGTSITIYGSSGSDATANSFGNGMAYIPNYLSSVAKSASTEGATANNSSTAMQYGIVAGLYNGTAAVTSLQIVSLNGWGFAQHSSASLYGILRGSDGITTAT